MSVSLNYQHAKLPQFVAQLTGDTVAHFAVMLVLAVEPQQCLVAKPS